MYVSLSGFFIVLPDEDVSGILYSFIHTVGASEHLSWVGKTYIYIYSSIHTVAACEHLSWVGKTLYINMKKSFL